MKEKISCSLDGKLVDRIDEVIKTYPIISNRSALIETACLLFMYCYNGWTSYDSTALKLDGKSVKRDAFIQREYERRCKFNAQKESENRNV